MRTADLKEYRYLQSIQMDIAYVDFVRQRHGHKLATTLTTHGTQHPS
jgi:hypothetical protein